MVKVSVVIPTFNSERTIGECLGSVLNQSFSDFEVIVVDDASTDRTLEFVKKFKDPRIVLIRNFKNKGPFIRNLGIKKAKGSIILLLDSDSIASSDWIKNHIEEHNFADIVGGSIQGINNSVFSNVDGFCCWVTSIPNSKRKFIKSELPTNNLSVKRNVFDAIGFFKPLRCGEDAEFCNRALKKGVSILFSPKILVKHYNRDSFKGFLKHQFFYGVYMINRKKYDLIEFSWLLPSNSFISLIYTLPLTSLHTGWLIYKWFKYYPKIIFYTPLLFIGTLVHKMGMSKGILDFKKSQKRDGKNRKKLYQERYL